MRKSVVFPQPLGPMLESDLGRVVPGAKADLVLYDLGTPWWTPLNDPVQQFVFGERGGAVRTVVVDGRVLVDEGRATTIDEVAVIAEARHILKRVQGRNAGVKAVASAVAALE